MRSDRLMRIALLVVGVMGLPSLLRAQAAGVSDQFHVTVPANTTYTDAIINLRNPNSCGTMTYTVFANTYENTASGACPGAGVPIAVSLFANPTTASCPAVGGLVIAPGDVHRVRITLAPGVGILAQPNTLSIEYTGVGGANAHLEADFWLYTGDPTNPLAVLPIPLVSSFPLVRRGLR